MSDSPTEVELLPCVVFSLSPPHPASAEVRHAWDAIHRPQYQICGSAGGDDSVSSDVTRLARRGMPALQIDTDTESVVSDLLTPITQEEALPDFLCASKDSTKSALGTDEGDLDATGRHRSAPRRGLPTPRPAVTSFAPFPKNTSNPVGTQGYVLFLDVTDATGQKTPFPLLADTGSNLSWILAENPAGLDETGKRVPWDADFGRTPKEQLHVPGLDCMAPIERLAEFGTLTTITYDDSCEAKCVILARRVQCSLWCYDWRKKETYSLELFAHLAAAYAVNVKLARDTSSGTLALGFSIFQEGNDTSDAPVGVHKYSSFIDSLSTHLKGGPDTRRESYSIHLTIRPHPGHYPGADLSSWLAFNEWPFSTRPRFSSAISLHRNAYGHGNNTWSVTLVSMEFLHKSSDTHGVVVTFAGEGHRGIEILLDSGTSLSYLPSHAIEKIHVDFFGNPERSAAPSKDKTTYTVAQDTLPDAGRIRYTFATNIPERQDVVLTGPINHFVLAKDISVEGEPLTGLIRSTENAYGVFGLNFMQTMYISLHMGRRGPGWVHMAPQFPEDYGRRYNLPNNF